MELKSLNYILGLDLGIASCGWAVVEIDEQEQPIRLIDTGVRTFEEASAKTWRDARGKRRLIRRRAHRLLCLRRLLKCENVLQAEDFDENGLIIDLPNHVWNLRVQGLERQLKPKEWAAVLLHLVKHRGYLSQRKSENQTTDEKLGKLLSGVNQNHKILQENQSIRTPAELAIKEFAIRKDKRIRNTTGDYSHTFNRLDLLDELNQLFDAQTRLGNRHVSGSLKATVRDLLMTQRAALPGNDLLEMLGKCTFEPNEYKAAKNTYSAERFNWLTKLNNLRIQDNGLEYALDEQQRQLLINAPYEQDELTYQQVREKLSLPESAHFKGLRYGKDEAESAVFMEMKAWHAIRKAMENNGLKTEWQSIATKPDLLDAIGTAFSIYKTDDEISANLNHQLPENVLAVLLEHINFSGFINLSFKALAQILPLMEQGQRYDEAHNQIYPPKSTDKTQHILPNIPADEIRNPVVLRTLTQARKVINAIVRRYGSPARVHIETGREVGKSSDERDKIKKKQEENFKQRADAVAKFKKQFPNFVGEPKAKDILKWRLYQAQHGKCLYSGLPLDISRLAEKGYAEIDHALPFSRTWDDSFNNKVLVLTRENQNKRNQTPYEYLDGKNNSERWKMFVANVSVCEFSYAKKQRIMLHHIDEKGFIERNLNDTRYVARFLCHFIADHLYLTGKGKRRVFASNGQITALLRSRWGLVKSRDDNDRHHALDAIVVACSTVAMQQKITQFVRYKEGNVYSGERIDKETGEVISLHFPTPWAHFREDVMIRVFDDNPREKLPESQLHEFVQPLFVSRMPTRKMSGQGHLATIKSAKHIADKKTIDKIPLQELTLSDIPNIVGYKEKREPMMYAELENRLKQFNNKPLEAFAEPFYKQGKQGKQQIKSIRVWKQQTKLGLRVRNGITDDRGKMVRVDVFEKSGKFYLVPIYAWQVAKGILPNKAATQDRDESEWEEMNDSFTFQFSLYHGDLVELVTKKRRTFGYFAGLDRDTGAINIREHDRDKQKVRYGIHRSLGVKKGVISFKKFQVDVLGKDIRECRFEKRLGVR